MTKEDKDNIIQEILSTVQFLPMEFSDLGWDVNGCPDGEKCDEFEVIIGRLADLVRKIRA